MRQGKDNYVLRESMRRGLVTDPVNRPQPEKMPLTNLVKEIAENEEQMPDIIPTFGYHESSCRYLSDLQSRQKRLYEEMKRREEVR